MRPLSLRDYKHILDYYTIPYVGKPSEWIYERAEHILGTKLCRCIKKVTKHDGIGEPGAIGICTNSIFAKRNLKYYLFSCKKKYRLKPYPKKKRSLQKTQRRIQI